MSSYSNGWVPYVPVAKRRRQAAREMEKLRKKGHPVAPVIIQGRTIATTLWGKAWCDNLEGYRDYESRLPRGRTYVRNGSLLDLQIAAREVTAIVSGSSIYKVKVSIGELGKKQWASIRKDCVGRIDSLVELLQGRLSKGVMERICRQSGGLFPKPAEIHFSCSCLDHASMCKHVAAVLYGVGARLDEQPELLFRLRAVDEKDLVARIDTARPLGKQGPAAGKVLEADDLSALFGLEMDTGDGVAAAGDGAPASQPKSARAKKIAQPEHPAVGNKAAVKESVRPSTQMQARSPAGIKRTAVGKAPRSNRVRSEAATNVEAKAARRAKAPVASSIPQLR